MSKKVMLDAGHYGKYNQSPVIPAYYESEVMWKLHLMLKAALEAYGITVGTTRTNQAIDMAVYDRGKAAKGYDLLISLHSNATGKDVENIDYPVSYVSIDGKGDEIGALLAAEVARIMGTKQKSQVQTRKNNEGGDYYGITNGAKDVGSIGIILEHSFHTNTAATRWLLSDDNLKKMAEAEAAVIAAYFGISVDRPIDAGTPILSKPTVSIEQMIQWARAKKASDLFAELAPTFYKIASAAGVNPVVAYCQSAYETGYGTFKKTLLDASYKNPCGLKTSTGGGDNDASAHMRFASWEQGIQAQVDHLALYAGADGYPKAGTPDPRHFPFIAGTAKTVEALSGKWATNPPTYGDRIAEMMREIAAIKVVAPVPAPNNEPSDWAKPAWEWAKEQKIIVGGDPRSAATREQVAQMLFAALGGK